MEGLAVSTLFARVPFDVLAEIVLVILLVKFVREVLLKK